MTDKFGEAIGIWHLTVGKADLELKPIMGDNRKFRKILMNDKYKNDKDALMDKFEEFMYDIIKRDYPEEPEDKMKMYVEYNVQDLFEEVMVRFKWTTKDELTKSKQEAFKDIKKLTGDV